VWRGRRLATCPQTRPTTAAARETLFNLLAPYINGAACLDLFAGSGALGIEAVSRGARRAVLVEKDSRTAAKLANVIAALDGGEDGRLTLIRGDAFSYLRAAADEKFNIVFLDPPYADFANPADWRRLLDALLPRLFSQGALAFCESAADFAPPPPWGIMRAVGKKSRLLLRGG
jgi:16S rRNA (guanine966-N2)-methyltransferase